MGIAIKLDCGCSNNPRGDVNIDVTPNQSAPNFIRCDAHNLPFKDNSFSHTYCVCILEHLSHPYHALKEINRVTHGKIEITYDHFWSIYNWIGVGHQHLMLNTYFIKLPYLLTMLRILFKWRPLKAICRRAGLFTPWRYTHVYHT
jgi:ubiquinone/menaquinone biosynthesis C-methylase UbiE